MLSNGAPLVNISAVTVLLLGNHIKSINRDSPAPFVTITKPDDTYDNTLSGIRAGCQWDGRLYSNSTSSAIRDYARGVRALVSPRFPRELSALTNDGL